MCYQLAPCYSDQGAFVGQHVWGLDTHMTDDISKILGLFSLTLLQDLFLHLLAGSGLSGYTSPGGECSALFLIYPPY